MTQQQQTLTKRSYSYNDLHKSTNINSIYSTFGQPINSQLKSAPRTIFPRQQKSTQKKKYSGKQLQKDLIGKQGIGPAGYLPSQYTLPNGKLISAKDPLIQNKYQSTPSFSIGQQPRDTSSTEVYQYMKNNKDHIIDINQADMKRKNSSPNILIGTARRFSQQRKDKITPGPTYDPVMKFQLKNAPKYTIVSRKSSKGKDPLLLPTSTTTLVGPGSYFQQPVRSYSTSSLSRVPYDSTKKKQPIASFNKAPRTLQQLKNSVDQTYDIKTKTIMAHYDFQYDGGKGYHTGQAYKKKNIISSYKNPIERNRMGSYTIKKASREKQQTKRGIMKSMMDNVPQTVRIQIPKF